VVQPLLCQSDNDYYRIVARLGLDNLSVFLCFFCLGVLSPYGWGERKHLKMRVRRAWCPVCVIRYTILPVFVAPAKWYSYTEIERALLFISWPEFRSITAGLKAWEIERQHRIDNGSGAGPAASTVRLWLNIFGQVRADGQWPAAVELEKAFTTTSNVLTIPSQECSDSPAITILPEEPWVENPGDPAIQAPNLAPESNSSPAEMVLQKLRSLGKALLAQWSVTLATSLLAIGAWFLDGEVGTRCLAPIDLTGKIVPRKSPSLAVTAIHRGVYPPHTYPPP
jgi:hypothetical protein